MKVYKKRVYKKKAPSKNKTPSKGIVKAVKTVLKRDAETKYVSKFLNNQTLNHYTTATSIPTFLITPAVNQGVADGQRIGNQITTSSVMLRYRLYAPVSLSTPIRLVRVLIVKEKAFPVRDPSIHINTTLFRGGFSSGTFGPQNNDLDQLYKINTEVWTVIYDKQHKVGSSGNPASIGSNNNDYNQSVQVAVNLQRHFGKIQFDDTTGQPITKNYYIFFLVSPADGSTATSASDSGIKLSFDNQIMFKDV